LTLKKISQIGTTRCQILRLKCTKFDFRWGSAQGTAGGAYSAPQTLAVFKGPSSKRREREGERKREGKGRERERKGKRRGRGKRPYASPCRKFLATPLVSIKQ